MKPHRLLPLLFACACAHGDVFLLADGTRIEGISAEADGQVTISTFDGRTVKVAKKDIRGNIPEPRRNEYFARLKRLKNDDVKGRIELALYCQKNNLKHEAEELLQAALKIDPANNDAGKALGYEFSEGKWRPAQDNELTIGTRPQPLKRAATSEEAQALLKRLEKLTLDPKAPNAAPEVNELVANARENPAPLIKLLIPPQFPSAVPRVSPEVRARAAHLAGLAQDRRAMQALIDASIYDPEETVRVAAAKALPLLEEPVALRKIMDIAISGDNQRYPWPVRKVASQALRRYASQEVIERMMTELSFELAGGNPRDAKNRLRGKGAGIGSDNPLGVQDTNPDYGAADTDLYPVLSAMKEITGKSFDKNEKDMKTWIGWWKVDGLKFEFKD